MTRLRLHPTPAIPAPTSTVPAPAPSSTASPSFSVTASPTAAITRRRKQRRELSGYTFQTPAATQQNGNNDEKQKDTENAGRVNSNGSGSGTECSDENLTENVPTMKETLPLLGNDGMNGGDDELKHDDFVGDDDNDFVRKRGAALEVQAPCHSNQSRTADEEDSTGSVYDDYLYHNNSVEVSISLALPNTPHFNLTSLNNQEVANILLQQVASAATKVFSSNFALQFAINILDEKPSNTSAAGAGSV